MLKICLLDYLIVDSFIFSECPYQQDTGIVQATFENFTGKRDNIQVPREPDITAFSLLAPYNSSEHNFELTNYSDAVRLVASYDSAVSSNVEMTVDYQLSAYLPSTENYDEFVYDFSISRDEVFSLAKVDDKYTYSVYYLDSDHTTWRQKAILDVIQTANNNGLRFLLDKEMKGQENVFEGEESSLISLVSTGNEFKPVLEFYLNTPLQPRDLSKEISSEFDIFCPEIGMEQQYLKFRGLNLFYDLWPVQNSDVTEMRCIRAYPTHQEFFRNYLEHSRGIRPECLISTQDRNNTDSCFIFHFRAQNIYVKAGIFYVTSTAFQVMKETTFFKEALSNNWMIGLEKQTFESIVDGMNSGNDIQRNDMLDFLGDAKNRTTLTKIMVLQPFGFSHTVKEQGLEENEQLQTWKFDGVLAFEVRNPGPNKVNFKELSNVTNLQRHRELVRSGQMEKYLTSRAPISSLRTVPV